MKAWRFCRDHDIEYVTIPLQLGHAGEGVEIEQQVTAASVPDELQLGHAGEGVEMLAYWFNSSYSNALQLGHAGEGVEIWQTVWRYVLRH